VPQEIYDMAEQNGTIYAGSADGLIAVKKPVLPVNKKLPWSFVNYGKREGFPYNDYNQNTGIVTKNGQSWWGITPVLTVVTQEPVADTLLPQVNITGINIMDKSLSFTTWSSLGNHLKTGDTLWDETKTTYYLKNTLPKDSGYLINHHIRWDSITPGFKLPTGLTLPHDQNSVNFSFNNNDIKGREKIMYRYILEGADKTWSEVSDKSSTRNYFNLTAGHYTFRVSTKGFNGLWSAVEEYSFTILPPWWKTWWAYILYIIAGAAVVGTYARYRSRQLIQKNILLENKISQRTSELSKSLEDLKTTQSQLIQSEKMASLGELTADIAHEIQNPLNFVNNFSEVNKELLVELKDEIKKGNIDEVNALADDIVANEEKIIFHGKRADGIVKGMLQHSRSSNSTKEPTDINKLADEYLRLAYHGLRAKDKSFNVTLKTDFDETIGKINIIPQDIGRVILNLITNAFYVVDEKKKQNIAGYEPTVEVSTQTENNKILVSVKDNGNGIPQKVLDKIFQPFFTTKPTGQGTGLGLSLSYDIVKAHGGELRVETKDGEGSAFIIQLPIQS
jgi:signal transduction histidine kinase